MSKAYQAYLGEGLTPSLVAMRAEESSTRTVGVTQLQLFYGMISEDRVFDRLLSGPTNDVWITPWMQYLRKLNVEFNTGFRVIEIKTDGSRVSGVTVEDPSENSSITADFYIAAMPVDVMAAIMTDELKRAAPSLANLDKLSTRWMNGIQFYLRKDEPLVNGHAIYLDSPWALTSISQKQFWSNVNLARYGDGTIRGILSVDVSNWDAPGVVFGKPARECTAEQIKEEVWTQLKQHLNVGGVTQIDDANLVSWFLDPTSSFPIRARPLTRNFCS